MNKKLKKNWWIDISLFVSFLITFYLDLTGLSLHQWIGIASIALAVIHLFLHRDWVRSIGKRFFQKQLQKTHFYFTLDSFILLGFALIGLTGLAMSTWFNLPLPNYDAWRQVHILISLGTLVLVLVKIAFHLRWFENVIRKLLAGTRMAPVQNLAVQTSGSSGKSLGRREFMLTLGVMGTASFIALASASKSLAESLSTPALALAEPEPTQTVENTATTLPTATETAEATAQPTQTDVVTATPTAATPAATTETGCTVRCQRGCSYPGHCRRYTDANNNNLCDLGECL